MNKPVSPAAVIRSEEHWTNRGDDVRLFLWNKHGGDPSGPAGRILFVHGSSMASQPTFDLAVPGRPDSSVMDWFAKRGFVCWSVDMEGYGRSDKSRDIPCDIANGADDLAAATDYMRRARGVERVMAYGISSGALREPVHRRRIGAARDREIERRLRGHRRAVYEQDRGLARRRTYGALLPQE